MMSAQYRQGDVLLMKVQNLPENAQQKPVEDRIILAYGEVTGHTHSICKDDAKLYAVEAEDFLVVEKYAHLTHEEHDTIDIPHGIYKVIRQREYSPRSASSAVID